MLIYYPIIIITIVVQLFISSFLNYFYFQGDDQRFVIQLVKWRPKFHLKLSLETGVLLLWLCLKIIFQKRLFIF